MAKKSEPTYVPPFTVSDEITTLVADIAEAIGHLTAIAETQPTPQMQNKILSLPILIFSNNSKLYTE